VDIIDTIRDFIVGELGYTGSRDELTPSRDLLDADVIDSIGVFKLVSFIEDRWDIEIDDDELVPENFATLEAMTSLVQARVG
jgi:acyl carrier protein